MSPAWHPSNGSTKRPLLGKTRAWYYPVRVPLFVPPVPVLIMKNAPTLHHLGRVAGLLVLLIFSGLSVITSCSDSNSPAPAANPSPDAATYRSFSSHFGIGDMIEFFFRRDSIIVAGMSVMWCDGSKVPDSAMSMAVKMHEYMEFNLLRGVTGEPSERKIARFGLTAREREVLNLIATYNA